MGVSVADGLLLGNSKAKHAGRSRTWAASWRPTLLHFFIHQRPRSAVRFGALQPNTLGLTKNRVVPKTVNFVCGSDLAAATVEAKERRRPPKQPRSTDRIAESRRTDICLPARVESSRLLPTQRRHSGPPLPRLPEQTLFTQSGEWHCSGQSVLPSPINPTFISTNQQNGG